MQLAPTTQYLLDNYTPAVGKVLVMYDGQDAQQTKLLQRAGFDAHAYDDYCVRRKGVHVTDAELYIDTAWDVILLPFHAVLRDKRLSWAMRRTPRVILCELSDGRVSAYDNHSPPKQQPQFRGSTFRGR